MSQLPKISAWTAAIAAAFLSAAAGAQGAPTTTEAADTAAPEAAAGASAPEAVQKADPSSAASGPESHTGAVAEVFVTSQHRKESIQKIPVTVTAIGGDNIREQELRKVDDLAAAVPNVHISTIENGGANRPRIFVRGLGTNDNRGVRLTPFGVYFDGVYINSPAGQALPLFDVERIEVLRGPQGTLYGKNSLSGALNLITKDPTFANEGYFKASYAEYDESQIEGAISGGLSDSLAARLAFFDNRRDSYVKNSDPDGPKPLGPADTAVRGKLLFTPGGNSDVTLNLHRRDQDSDGYGWIFHPGNDPSQRFPHKTFIGSLASGETSTWGASLTGNVGLGDTRLTSITAYEDIEDRLVGSGSNARRNFSESDNNLDVWQISQEFRLASADTGGLRWITGVHLFREKLLLDNSSAVTRQGGTENATSRRYINDNTQQWDESAAVFGSLTWAATERLELTAGLRYTWQQKDVDLERIGSPAGQQVIIQDPNWNSVGRNTYGDNVLASQDQKETWKDTTWDVNAQYSFIDNLRGYAKVSRGFQAGGFNLAPSSLEGPDIILPSVDPEFIDNYELGVKSEWWNNRIVSNLAAFYYDYKDAQIFTSPQVSSTGVSTGSATLNADKSTVYGLEAELRAQLTEHLGVWGNLGLLDTEYKKFTEAALSIQDKIIGNRFTRSPTKTATLGVDYTLPFLGGELQFGGDLHYESLIWFNPVNQNEEGENHGYKLAQGGHTVSNARVLFRPASNRYQLSAYVRNLGDKDYRTIATQTGGSVGPDGELSYNYQYGSPRVFGASVTVNF